MYKALWGGLKGGDGLAIQFLSAPTLRNLPVGYSGSGTCGKTGLALRQSYNFGETHV